MLLLTIIIQTKGVPGVNTDVGIRFDICTVESDLDLNLASWPPTNYEPWFPKIFCFSIS